MDALKTELLPVAQLAGMGAPYNPRKIDPKQLAALGRSLRTFGAVEPVVANRRTGRIVGGHQRVKAAQAERIESLPVVWVDLDEKQEKQLNLALNRISGEWDEVALAALLEEMGTAAIDLTGFDGAEVEELISRIKREARAVDPDEVPEPPKVAKTKPGDLYVLGKHRLLCGDSTKAGDVARLMCGEKAAVIVTDPPYGVAYRDTGAGSWGPEKLAKKRAGTLKPRFEAIADDDLTGPELVAFWTHFLSVAIGHLGHGAAVYCCFASLRAPEIFAAYDASGLEPRAELVWVKSRPGFNFAHYKHKHEPILYAAQKGQPANWYGDRSQVSTLEVASESGREYNHPTQKPVELLQVPIGNSTRSGEIILEPFLGSGSTLIAAEQLNRRCFGLEIDPIYCDVIVARWENFTGQKAVLEAAS